VKEPAGGTTPLQAGEAAVETVPAVGLHFFTPRLLVSPVIVAMRQTEKPMATVGGLFAEAGAGRKVVLGTTKTDTVTLDVMVTIADPAGLEGSATEVAKIVACEGVARIMDGAV